MVLKLLVYLLTLNSLTNAWRNTPTENGGIGAVKYALAADVKHEIAKAYGIEHPEEGVALRASFLIDKTVLFVTKS